MKKNKNGFTLVELLGVIVILILIISLVLPKIIGNTRSKKKEVASIDDDIVMSAVKLYVEEHKKDYPEENGNRYCIHSNDEVWTEISKYLAQNKNYSDNDIAKEIQIDYDENKGYMVVENSSCVPSGQGGGQGETQTACYVSKTYNNLKKVYLFEDKTISNVDNTNIGNVISLPSSMQDSNGQSIPSQDACKYHSLEAAALQYAIDHPREFRKISGKNYCLSLSTLISEGYLNDEAIKLNSVVNPSDYGKDIRSTYSFSVLYNVEESRYVLTLTNSCSENFVCGTYIDLPSNMTPVIYDENVEKWKIVDEFDPDWFDYENQKWANAVILTPTARSTKKVGDYVEVDVLKKNSSGVQNTLDTLDVLGMYVWIPRYSYSLKVNKTKTSSNTYGYQDPNAYETSYSERGGFAVKCIPKSIKDTGDALYEGDVPDITDWHTMPGFTFDGKELNGMWVGKFQISDINSNAYLISCNSLTCSEADNLRVLPNMEAHVVSATNTRDMFYASLSANRSGNIFENNSSELDSHLQKNSEYSTILYLGDSKYGKYGNKNYSGENKIPYVNNSQSSGHNTSGDYYKRFTGKSSGNSSLNPSTSEFGSFTYDDFGYTHNSAFSLASTPIFENVSWTLNVFGGDSPSNIEIGSGGSNDSKGILVTIPEGKVGYFTYTLTKGGTNIGNCTKISLSYTKYSPKVNLKILRDGLEDIYSSSYVKKISDENYSIVLGPGKYNLGFYYVAKGKNEGTTSKKIGTECPTSNTGYAKLSNVNIKLTSNYNVNFTQINGVGASTTGNVYGVYDIRSKGISIFSGAEFVMTISNECTDNFKSSFSKYLDITPFDSYGMGFGKESFDGDRELSYSDLYCYQGSRSRYNAEVEKEPYTTSGGFKYYGNAIAGYRNVIILK